MVRALHEVMKLNEMDFLVSELKKPDESGAPIFRRMLTNSYREKDTHASNLVLVQIPPFVEQYLHFVLASSSKQNFNKHLGWLFEKLEINQGTIAEYLLPDVIRFVLLCTESHAAHSAERVHRWYVLGWLLRFHKSEVFSTMSKQALFIDWLYYRGESGWFKIFEPVWLLVINSIGKYREMSEELLDFLFLLTKEYDTGNAECDVSVMRVFDTLKNRNVTSLESLLESDYLSGPLKFKLEGFLQRSEGQGNTDRNIILEEGLTTTPGDYVDVIEEIGIEGSAKKENENDSKIDKYLTENLYYHSEHHQGKSNIIEREKHVTILSRTQELERLGENVPLFIRELPAFQSFAKEASFGNLSFLLKEIFDLALTLATKAYSPNMMDQLSQEQILKETSEFIIMLFAENASGDLNLRNTGNFDETYSKILERNVDIETDESKENQHLLIAGISLFIFISLSKFYSENLNYYALMERLTSILLEKYSLMYMEFMFFLLAVESDSQNHHVKLLQQVFQGMYFEKMCDIINRCCSYLEVYPQILSATLKYLFISMSTDHMLAIIRVILLSVVKTKQDHFKSVLLFILKIFNPKVAFELELGKTFKNLSPAYRSNLKPLMLEAIKQSAGPIQCSFWQLHKIICQE